MVTKKHRNTKKRISRLLEKNLKIVFWNAFMHYVSHCNICNIGEYFLLWCFFSQVFIMQKAFPFVRGLGDLLSSREWKRVTERIKGQRRQKMQKNWQETTLMQLAWMNKILHAKYKCMYILLLALLSENKSKKTQKTKKINRY